MDLPANSSNGVTPESTLQPWEKATIEFFIQAAGLVGLPRSLGEIYGFLFCARTPQTFDAVVDGLRISRGSVSQGLKLLRQLGAVKIVYLEGSRRDHYIPELAIKRLAAGFLKDQLEPHLESGRERLSKAYDLVELEPDPTIRAHAVQRLQTLQTWQRRCVQLLPIATSVLSGLMPLFSDNDSAHSQSSPLV